MPRRSIWCDRHHRGLCFSVVRSLLVLREAAPLTLQSCAPNEESTSEIWFHRLSISVAFVQPPVESRSSPRRRDARRRGVRPAPVAVAFPRAADRELHRVREAMRRRGHHRQADPHRRPARPAPAVRVRVARSVPRLASPAASAAGPSHPRANRRGAGRSAQPAQK